MGYLILTRNTTQSLMIGDDVKITILGIYHGQVRIGIDAPKDIKIWREELYEKIQQEKEGPSAPTGKRRVNDE